MARKMKDNEEDDRLRNAFKVFDRCVSSSGVQPACQYKAWGTQPPTAWDMQVGMYARTMCAWWYMQPFGQTGSTG